MKGLPMGPVPDCRWPLHPRPSEWEDRETWVRRIAEAYGVSYDAFLLNALDHTGRGARDLDNAPDDVLAKLSIGTGVSIEQLLEHRRGSWHAWSRGHARCSKHQRVRRPSTP